MAKLSTLALAVALALISVRGLLFWQTIGLLTASLHYALWLWTFELSEPMPPILFVVNAATWIGAFGLERLLASHRS